MRTEPKQRMFELESLIESLRLPRYLALGLYFHDGQFIIYSHFHKDEHSQNSVKQTLKIIPL